MAKLYFKYGVVNSSKSANALMTIHNYKEQGMRVFVIKPEIDSRDYGEIKSRALKSSVKCDKILKKDEKILSFLLELNVPLYFDVIVVDECQFLTESQVDELRYFVDKYDIPILCYGLKTDYMTKLFEGSKRLLEVADSMQEIKTVCSCGAKAIFNGRFDKNGNLIKNGEQVIIGDTDIYRPLCSRCLQKLSM